MIVCRECGERQGSDAVFCGRCGAFLEWEGERVMPAGGAADAQSASGAPAPSGDATSDSSGNTRSSPARDPAEQSREEPPEETDSRRPRAAVAARRPTEGLRRPRSAARRRVEGRLPTGSLICGGCGVGNDPARRFCRSCGHPLADARVVVRPPWWRRLISREKTYQAGTRKRPRRWLRPVMILLVLGAVVAAVVIVLGPLRPAIVDTYHRAQDMLLPPRQVRPTEVEANASVADHGAMLAFDGASNTYWASPPVDRDREVPWLRVTFEEPVDLVTVGVTAGTSTQTPEFVAAARPQTIEIAVETRSGARTEEFTLEDTAGFQEIDFAVMQVRRLRISVIDSNGSSGKMATAVTEVEFFARHG